MSADGYVGFELQGPFRALCPSDSSLRGSSPPQTAVQIGSLGRNADENTPTVCHLVLLWQMGMAFSKALLQIKFVPVKVSFFSFIVFPPPVSSYFIKVFLSLSPVCISSCVLWEIQKTEWKHLQAFLASEWLMYPSVWGQNGLQKTQMNIYHSQEQGRGQQGCHCGNTPERRKLSQVCLLYTHWMHFPITHLANRKESQTGLDACWPKTAPIPLRSDKWPTRKSGSLWTRERGRELGMIKVTKFCWRDDFN